MLTKSPLCIPEFLGYIKQLIRYTHVSPGSGSPYGLMYGRQERGVHALKLVGGGVQTRTAKCKRNDGGYVADNFCTKYGLAKPSVSQACNTHSCETYSWFILSWQGCGGGCTPNGIEQRWVECHRDSDFKLMDDSFCPKPKPAETRTCKDCSGCGYNETAYLEAKVKHCNAIRFEGRANWTAAQVRSYCISYDGSVRAHYDRYHVSENVCGYQSIYCCQQAGYKYYCKSWK